TTEENFGSVPKAYIGTTLDRVVSPKAQQFTQDFLGIDKDEVVMLPYGHVPLETAPEELANAIKKLATSKVLEKN
ncbi:MAG: alpha/beta hydrolase, partial [Flavobacteriales bacterium]|nr:alpha/beta hydrolase [Flavobacteriales bacterium]